MGRFLVPHQEYCPRHLSSRSRLDWVWKADLQSVAGEHMKTESINWLKEFLAAERGVAPAEISDQEAISGYRRRWRNFFIGLFVVICTYLILKLYLTGFAAKSFVALTMLISFILNLRALRFSGRLTAGPLLNIKKEVAQKLKINIDKIDDAPVQEYDRRNQQFIVRGLMVTALAYFLVEWIWPSSVAEVLALSWFYTVGALAWTNLRRNLGPSQQ
jgi:hypothetical protein